MAGMFVVVFRVKVILSFFLMEITEIIFLLMPGLLNIEINLWVYKL